MANFVNSLLTELELFIGNNETTRNEDGRVDENYLDEDRRIRIPGSFSEGLLTYVLRGEDPRGSLNGNISGM